LVSNNLDGDFFTRFTDFAMENTGANDIREHAFAKGGVYLVPAAIELFAEDNGIIALWIGG
jgi:hypothetical protein